MYAPTENDKILFPSPEGIYTQYFSLLSVVELNMGDKSKDSTLKIGIYRGSSEHKKTDYPMIVYRDDRLLDTAETISNKMSAELNRPVNIVKKISHNHDMDIVLYSEKTLADRQRALHNIGKDLHIINNIIDTLNNSNSENRGIDPQPVPVEPVDKGECEPCDKCEPCDNAEYAPQVTTIPNAEYAPQVTTIPNAECAQTIPNIPTNIYVPGDSAEYAPID